jgi:hypothetical protein
MPNHHIAPLQTLPHPAAGYQIVHAIIAPFAACFKLEPAGHPQVPKVSMACLVADTAAHLNRRLRTNA